MDSSAFSALFLLFLFEVTAPLPPRGCAASNANARELVLDCPAGERARARLGDVQLFCCRSTHTPPARASAELLRVMFAEQKSRLMFGDRPLKLHLPQWEGGDATGGAASITSHSPKEAAISTGTMEPLQGLII